MTITVSLKDLSKMIDHSLLHPTMTDAEVRAGCELSVKYDVATACIKPYHIEMAKGIFAGTSVKACAVIGFPHGNSATNVKVFEAEQAAREGAEEIDMVVNIGKVLGGNWDYVESEIQAINTAVVKGGSILKVIFENDFLNDEDIIRLCQICSKIGVAFVKTSTGYGFVKQSNGMYSYKGATLPHLKLMRKNCPDSVEIKAAGGVRTLDDLLLVRSVGVTRIGATATQSIMEEAAKRGIGKEPIEVEIKESALAPGGY